jgi:beta-galactosidase
MSRIVTQLKDDWSFTRVPQADATCAVCDDADWETVEVPHDWAIAGPFDRENDMERKVAKGQADIEESVRYITGRTGGLPHTGEGWYRKSIDIPASSQGRIFRLECDGIMSHSKIYCNGEYAGSWPYGYSSFAFDITAFIRPGETNVIAVHVNNPEKSSRWYPGAGIYRNVRLVELNPVHIDHWGVEITTPEVDDARGCVQVKTRLGRHAEADAVTLRTIILDPDGVPVSSELCEVSNDFAVEQVLVVNTPRRWSLETPEQYTVRSEVIVNDELTDSLDNRFGFRTLRFDSEHGFFLNDKPVKMKGVCQHHDLGPLGAAVNTAALRRQLRLLMDMGCNAIRTSHNPPAPELPALASEMGILIIDEAFDEWKYTKMANGYNTLWDEWAEKDLRAMIRRDRNHPAVIMWSTGNEISEQWKEDGAEISQFLVDICHDEDPTRPVTAGLNRAISSKENVVIPTVDIIGLNYQPKDYVRGHILYPEKPMYGSETASTVSSRGEYYFPAVDEVHLRRDTLQVNSYDLSYPGWATAPDIEFRAQDECDFIMGEFVWTGFDYLGEPTPYNEEWPSRSSYFGILDLGGIPKDRFYLYQSQWTDNNVLHLMPHWTWPGYEGQPIPVQCYTNYTIVELFVNGVSMGKRSRYEKYKVLESQYRFNWHNVPYETGELKVVAYGKDGSVVEERAVVTAGDPQRIELTPDRETLKADGDDMAFVAVRILDDQGNLCPRADTTIVFTVDGPARIAGLCNGDATSLESFKGNQMKAYNGQCVLYLKSQNGEKGPVTVSASADGLAYAAVTLQAE